MFLNWVVSTVVYNSTCKIIFLIGGLPPFHVYLIYTAVMVDQRMANELHFSVRALLGSHVRRQVLQLKVRWIFSRYSCFRPPQIYDRLKISEIILIGPLNESQRKKLQFSLL